METNVMGTVETMERTEGAWILTVPLFMLILIGVWQGKKMMMDENEKNVVGLLIFGLGVILMLIILVLHASYSPGSLLCWMGGVMSLACIVILAGLHFKWPGFTPPAATFLQFLLSAPLIAYVTMVVIGIKILLRH